MEAVIYDKVRIAFNLSVIGTMNTSNQNVFTLNTTFQHSWSMSLLENIFENVRTSLADAIILDTDVTWRTFCTTINKIIMGNKAKVASDEFVYENDLEYD